MEQVKCAYCFSTDVKIIGALGERRDAMMIECNHCGRRSARDTENEDAPAIAAVQPE
jgi:hypothetical protein